MNLYLPKGTKVVHVQEMPMKLVESDNEMDMDDDMCIMGESYEPNVLIKAKSEK